jgi:uncharacterized membrane protein
MTGTIMLFVYFIPTIMSWNKKNGKYLFIFNLLTAWTVLCWFISFVWPLQINRQHARILAEEKKARRKLKNLDLLQFKFKSQIVFQVKVRSLLGR